MNYDIHVGNVAFHISCARPLAWRECDEPFLGCPKTPSREVEVEVLDVDELPCVQGALMYENDRLSFYETGDGVEYRVFRARFIEGSPAYALSVWRENRLEVSYLASSGVWENGHFMIWNLLSIENRLLEADALALHSCCVAYRGSSVLFSAPHATGKSFHGYLWERAVAGSRVLNGDKTLLQKTASGWRSQGYPYHGGGSECACEEHVIRGIAILRQGEQNRIEELSRTMRLGWLYSECTVNQWRADRLERALDLIASLVDEVPVVMYHCTADEDAATTLHDFMYA